MCKNNCEQRTPTQGTPNTLLALKGMLFIILFVADSAASLEENQIHVAVEGGFSSPGLLCLMGWLVKNSPVANSAQQLSTNSLTWLVRRWLELQIWPNFHLQN